MSSTAYSLRYGILILMLKNIGFGQRYLFVRFGLSIVDKAFIVFRNCVLNLCDDAIGFLLTVKQEQKLVTIC